jgi:hypothetical protein
MKAPTIKAYKHPFGHGGIVTMIENSSGRLVMPEWAICRSLNESMCSRESPHATPHDLQRGMRVQDGSDLKRAAKCS